MLVVCAEPYVYDPVNAVVEVVPNRAHGWIRAAFLRGSGKFMNVWMEEI